MTLERIGRIWALVVRMFAWAGLLSLLALTLVTLADVAMRNGLGKPILGLNELFGLFGVASVGAFLPFALSSRQLLTVAFFGSILGERAGTILNWFADICTLVFLLALLWSIRGYTSDVVTNGEATYLLGLATGPWWIWVVICLVVSTIAHILTVTGIMTRDMLVPPRLGEDQS
ncbi:MAG: TRAP transporter small permease subunit [Pseudomonadota bacterium]|nr:TRAP transporter small permease subunit [Pseudomonadota bacterium]MEE2859677.1 TRAP transporter small permease subunit [Pseudomonadota bacterium]